jgi:UDP-N-acetylglucosamine 2-epimerase
LAAIDRVESDDFRRAFSSVRNPYGDGDSCAKAYRFIREADFVSMKAKVEDPITVQRLFLQ